MLLLAACGPGDSGPVGLAKDQVFSWPYVGTDLIGGPGVKAHAEVFDPAVVGWAGDLATISMIYSPLVTFDHQLSVVPDAATWEVDPGGTVYTFHLRQNLKFSDGSPLRAQDYAYSIDRALDPHICDAGGMDGQTYAPGNCYYAGSSYLTAILGADARINGNGGSDHSVVGQSDDPNHGVDIIDPYTLRIRLSSPAAYFLEALTYPTSYPVRRSLVEKYPNGLWVDHLDEGGCSGPFMIKSYGDGKQLTLVKNPNWEDGFGKQLTLTEVDRPLVGTGDEEYASYKAGLYDYSDIPGSKYANAQSQDGFHEVPQLETDYFALNFNQPPFNNQKVRQAFALALNKQLLVDRVYRGGALPTNHIVPRGMPGFTVGLVGPDGTQSVTGNAAKAVELLQSAINDCKAADTPGPECPFITSVNGQSLQPINIWYSPKGATALTRKALTDNAQQMWQAVLGLNVVSKQATSGKDFKAAINKPGGPYQGWIIGWLADYPDPQDFLSLNLRSNADLNITGMSDGTFDSLVDKADREIDQVQRMKDYGQAEQQALNLSAWVPLLQPKQAWFTRPWVQHFNLTPLLFVVDSDWPNIYISAH